MIQLKHKQITLKYDTIDTNKHPENAIEYTKRNTPTIIFQGDHATRPLKLIHALPNAKFCVRPYTCPPLFMPAHVHARPCTCPIYSYSRYCIFFSQEN